MTDRKPLSLDPDPFSPGPDPSPDANAAGAGGPPLVDQTLSMPGGETPSESQQQEPHGNTGLSGLGMAMQGDRDAGPASAKPSQGAAINPKWGRAAAQAAGTSGNAGREHGAAPGGPGAPGSSQGAWLWLPQGIEPKKPWRKRHPFLFWGGFILLLALTFSFGKMIGKDSFIRGPKIAVVNVDGIILDAGSTVAWMEKVRKDSSYAGAVIRINSPGGAVGPSQEIYTAIKRLARDKPTAVSMGSLAASGGYYAALGGDIIFAGPSTLTASIGVKMQVPNLEGLMHTIGISEKTLTTGKLKDAGSSWRAMNPEEEAYFRALLKDMYEEFIATVAEERELPLSAVRAVADGRAMTGRQALEAKLVDRLGDMHDAVQWVKEQAGLQDKEPNLVEGPEKPTSMLSDLMGSVLRTAIRQTLEADQPIFLY